MAKKKNRTTSPTHPPAVSPAVGPQKQAPSIRIDTTYFFPFPLLKTNTTAITPTQPTNKITTPINTTITTITQAHKNNKHQQPKEGLGGLQIPHFLPATDFDYFEQIIKRRTVRLLRSHNYTLHINNVGCNQ
jgi:hypothetical protein